MTEQHKATLLKANAAVSQGDHEGFLDFCTESTEWTFVGDLTLTGKEEVRAWMKKTYIVPPEVTVERLISDGEFLVAIGDIAITDASGQKVKNSYCDVWRFNGDKLDELKAFVV